MPDSLSSPLVKTSGYPRSYRLTSKADLQSVFDQPVKVTRKGIITLFRRNERDTPRLGILISKQQMKRAVDRNHCRRIVRESFRQIAQSLIGLDIVVMLRKDWLNLPNAEMRIELSAIWQQVQQKKG